MNHELAQLLNALRDDRGLSSRWSEKLVERNVIKPVLTCLGWDCSNRSKEVLEHRGVGGGIPDFCLKDGTGKRRVFLEAKKAGENLSKAKHQEQLIRYAWTKNVDIAILTNGASWLFFLPAHKADWDKRRIDEVDITKQPVGQSVEILETLLSKENVNSGAASSRAKSILDSRRRDETVRQNLPSAWSQVLDGPDDRLVDLLADATERLCSHRPSKDTIVQFLRGPLRRTPAAGDLSRETEVPPKRIADATWKHPRSFTFQGQEYPVRFWNEVLAQLCAILSRQDGAKFRELAQKYEYLSRRPGNLRQPKKVDGTAYFVETALGANHTLQRCRALLHYFGFDPDALRISCRRSGE